MSRESNGVASGGGLPTRKPESISAEMEAFDRLPQEVRRLLQDAPFDLSAEATLEFARKRGAVIAERAVRSSIAEQLLRASMGML